MQSLVRVVVVGVVLALAGCSSASKSSTGRLDTSLALSQCMRSHGVLNFPDPDAHGGINLDSASGINPDAPVFRAAEVACRAYLPTKAPRTMSAAVRARAYAFARCMRAN